MKTYGTTYLAVFSIFKTFLPSALPALFDMGIATVVSKRTSQEKGKVPGELLLGLMLISGMLGFFLLILLHTFSHFISDIVNIPQSINKTFTHGLSLILSSYPFWFISLIAQGYLNGIQKTAILKKSEMITFFIGNLSIALIIFLKLEFIYIALTMSINFIVLSILFIILSLKNGMTLSKITKRIKSLIMPERKMLTSLSVNRLAGVTFKQTDVLLISSLLGTDFLSQYEIATKFPFFFKVLLGKTNELIIPLAGKFKTEKKALDLIINKLFLFQFSLSLLFFIFLYLNSKLILNIWMGESYVNLSSLFDFTCLILILHPMTSVIPSALFGIGGNISLVVKTQIFSSAIGLLTTLTFLSTFGLKGPILGTLVSMLLSSFIFLKKMDISINAPSRFILKKIALIAATGGAVIAINFLGKRPTFISLSNASFLVSFSSFIIFSTFLLYFNFKLGFQKDILLDN